MMQITNEDRGDGEPPHRALKQAKNRSPKIQKNGVPAAVSASPASPPLRPADDQTVSAAAPAVKVADAAKDDGARAAANSMQTINEPAGTKLAPAPLRASSAVRPTLAERPSIQRAVFPDASQEDWDTLLCSERGQSLIRQTEALLNRRAVLQVLLGEVWFSPDALEKLEEWIAADKEVQAIGRELAKFQGRAKAIIDSSRQN